MKRLPMVLSAAALVVAVFGSTPLGHAVTSAVPPFAKKAAYAERAGTAGALNGIKASKQPRAGQLVPLGQDGKFPASVGIAGPAGPQGPKGDTGEQGPAGPKGATGPKGAEGPSGPAGTRGPSGVSGWTYLTAGETIKPGAAETKTWQVNCPAGKKALGGGVAIPYPNLYARILQSAPSGAAATGWLVSVRNEYPNYTITAYVWVICASVTS